MSDEKKSENFVFVYFFSLRYIEAYNKEQESNIYVYMYICVRIKWRMLALRKWASVSQGKYDAMMTVQYFGVHSPRPESLKYLP